MERLYEILEEVEPGINYEEEKHLIEDEILDSFAIVTLVTKLNEEYDIEITPADLVPENFESAECIMNLIERLQEE